MRGAELLLFLAVLYFCGCVFAVEEQPSHDWVIGYGSLMNSKYYAPNDRSVPVRVRGKFIVAVTHCMCAHV
jgi:hypothetical protein